MYKCINKSKGDMGHLEQMVSNFFPYSQKALSFDKPISIIFQSDEENASKMLGKTAFYDPQNLEIVLYVDNRHPKDVLRSLSHELVHHAQNCRGDFHSGCDKEGWNNACVKDTGPGYAQRDPHMRKMEREAYTKGNLIFRDFEDLIKTGKINIEIDFSDSGEPTMSLNEWKNNELNTLLMKKWGLLKEDKSKDPDRSPETPGDPGYEEMIAKEKGGEEELEETHVDLARSRGQLHKIISPEDVGEDPDLARAMGVGPKVGAEPDYTRDRVEIPAFKEPPAPPPAPGVRVTDPKDLMRTTTEVPPVRGGRPTPRRDKSRGPVVRGQRFEEKLIPRKISVREAKEITRRIVERIRKEAK